MKRRVLSVIVVLGIVLTILVGNTAKANESGVWFIFTSFGEIESVEIINETTGAIINLGEDELFDYETLDFIDSETKLLKLVKTYKDGFVVEQQFDITGAKSIVGIYDDGTCGESWMEIDQKYIY